jgi:hypothetical protein
VDLASADLRDGGGGTASTEGTISPQSAINPDEPTRRRQKMWYEDILTLTVNSLETKITYFWDGTCALGGYTSAPITYRSSSGWRLASGSSSESESCSAYTGKAWANFSNDVFCTEPGGYFVVWVKYLYNNVSGSYKGVISYAYSSSVSTSCAPLYFHRLTGSW